MADTPTDPDKLRAEFAERIRENSKRFTIFGIVLIVIGTLAILFPFLGSIFVKVTVGWFLLLSGAITLYAAFQTKTWNSAILNGLIGLLHLVAGAWLAFSPTGGLIALTFLLGIVFGLQGGVETAMALQNRGHKGWGWLLASGIASLVLGLLLILGLPGTAVWALGIFAGINFVTTGIAFVALARGVRDAV
ncbi:HdeD family acid-resistance protein [Aestuariibius sp. 2305UL40-4]|uniref:HdeD family acid-resistance protein n=1 Tax=Aestuariibius violaceus TaxID=3234132 RepID=UPI00345EC529